MKRVIRYAVSVLAIGLAAPACAAVSAAHGVMASAESDVLSTIASTLDTSASSPADAGGSTHDGSASGALGDPVDNGGSMPLGGASSADNSTGAEEAPGSVQHDNVPSSSARGASGGATPRAKRSALTWQSLIPGSIQQ